MVRNRLSASTNTCVSPITILKFSFLSLFLLVTGCSSEQSSDTATSDYTVEAALNNGNEVFELPINRPLLINREGKQAWRVTVPRNLKPISRIEISNKQQTSIRFTEKGEFELTVESVANSDGQGGGAPSIMRQTIKLKVH